MPVGYGPSTARGDGRTSKKGQAYGNRDERESSCSVLLHQDPPCCEAGCGYGSEPVSLVWGHRPPAYGGWNERILSRFTWARNQNRPCIPCVPAGSKRPSHGRDPRHPEVWCVGLVIYEHRICSRWPTRLRPRIVHWVVATSGCHVQMACDSSSRRLPDGARERLPSIVCLTSSSQLAILYMICCVEER